MKTNPSLQRFPVTTYSKLFLALALGAAMNSTAVAADTSEDPTSMPDYCSNLDVNCILPGTGQPVLRALPPTTVMTQPSSTPTVPSAQAAFTTQGANGTNGSFTSKVASPAVVQGGTASAGAGFAAVGRGRAR